jgi:hypothetical protein
MTHRCYNRPVQINGPKMGVFPNSNLYPRRFCGTSATYLVSTIREETDWNFTRQTTRPGRYGCTRHIFQISIQAAA